MSRRRKLNYTKEDYDLMYWDLSMSLREIAEVSECGKTTIHRDMIKKGVILKTLSEAMSEARYLKNARIKINWSLIYEILDGCVLGDASIISINPKTARFGQGCASRYLSFLEDIKEKFDIAGLKSEIELSNSNEYPSFLLYTIFHPDLKSERDRWYPEGIKVVPKDVIITPISAAYWYMCDGNYEAVRAGHVNTQGFSYDDVEYLCEVVKDKFDILCYPRKAGIAKDGRQKYRIYIPVPSFPRFVEIIEPYILPVFRYKLGK